MTETRKTPNGKWEEFRIVSSEEARMEPYPYVYVTDDGAVHELADEQREHLETFFHPFDGLRPYIKSSFDSTNGWGNQGGFCQRSMIPDDVMVIKEPFKRPQSAAPLKAKTPGFSTAAERKKWWKFWQYISQG